MNELPDEALRLIAYFKSIALSLIEPSGLMQIGLLVALFGLAHLISSSLEPRMETWVRSLTTERVRLRQLAIILRSIRGLSFVVLSWCALFIMRAATWPSLSFFIGIAANLATAWVLVSISSRLFRNAVIAGIFRLVAWTVAVLNVLGLTEPVVGLLDASAVTIGASRISVLIILKMAALLTFLFWLAAFLSSTIEGRVARVGDVSPSLRVLISKLSKVALFAVAIIISLQTFGFNLTSLTVFSGAVGVGIGFGLQKVVSNLVSGIIVLLDRSIKPGDVISVGETFGWITTLGARYTSVVTRDGREFLIPNEDLITNQVINWSYSNKLVRLEVPFGVHYNADPHLVRKIAAEAAQKPARVVDSSPPVCHLVAYGASSIDFVLRFWIRDPDNGVVNIKGEVLLALWDGLKEHDIAIPYPQLDLHLQGSAAVDLLATASARDARRAGSGSVNRAGERTEGTFNQSDTS